MSKGIRAKYRDAKKARIGDPCTCPSCGTDFEKKSYNQTFCKTKGSTICKDKYWNTVDPNKRNNTTRISPANARWQAKMSSERQEKFNPHDMEHPFSSEALGQE